ncbi:EAL domain-containing protein [Jeotgalibacillus sp. ET6]|uniref:putative bifunctional diguanylate cyclase/phosphodiesterase n=1 Tax=Jeotgalibacillus sp. ET6 TaxID=3037260 RepID=UPI00241838CA|nr:EAL domain-containing protein [Jeotgalibacillus sp. ET6]MDG5472165.1 EAL domain-containing protein [Jeotgalibacillus sp. ET6]
MKLQRKTWWIVSVSILVYFIMLFLVIHPRPLYMVPGLLVLVLVLSYLFNKLIVSRVENLSKQLKRILTSKELSSRLTWSGHNQDEIHQLGSSINEMLDSIEEAQKEVNQLERCDPLTGLLNRYGLQEEFHNRHLNQLGNISFLFLDLDGFKRINDSLGHQTGDELLKQMTNRMLGMLQHDQELLGRMGGDEFVMIVPDMSKEELVHRTHEMMRSLKSEYSLEQVKTYITTSVGISRFPEDGNSFEEVFQYADIAMYEAKRKGKNQIVFYEELARDLDYKHVLDLENDLKFSLDQGELYLDYQPIYSSGDHLLVGVEALLRWNHPQKGLIPPNRFIPIAENGGFICDIGEWVLEQSIRQAARWRDAGLGEIGIAINVSKQQMKQKDRFIMKMDKWLKQYNVAPSELQIEITESDIFYYDNEIREFAQILRNKGVRVALDDFGVGTSSLFNLKQLPVNVVKIDRSFIRCVPQESFDTTLLAGIYHVLDDLGFEVVTEGVESADQMEFVSNSSSSMIQGYYFSRPVSPHQIALLIQQQLVRQEAAAGKKV